MKGKENKVNVQETHQTENQTSDGVMDLFEIMETKDEEEEILTMAENEVNHSLVCNNELFNKELWAIVDDTVHEE
ncbi:hypothetical protein [Bacillus sp. CECT 9360]|uniref:hypothetical protein n=1 Tax=Bacillus sp. CECT 9360 TaxID=2845821 RepID=UPI001E3DD3EF|nr:hypothetical protein [Bacillus sp. CECT 9360]CAH0344276.1 hypothetical protein BCI9360_00520 [Bacillus sp. CECT 9360]